jgi:signal transduction histidine kinase
VRVSGNLSDELADRIPAREAVLGRGPRSFMLRTDRIWSIALAPTVRGFAGGAALVALPLDDDALRAAATGSAWEVDLFLDGRLRYATDPAPYTAGLLPRQLSAATDWEGRGGSELPTFAWGGIRGMRHLSAYRPLTDYVGLTVGTISQRRFGFWGLRDPDLDRLFATVASIYLLLVGAVTLVAVLIARRISEPVGELTRSVRRVSGGDLEVNIPVTRGDEVGGLQKAFRQMLIALRENRDRLAQAERERAWQQMARQVAHEIKNPLTPMRLSAQFLRKAYDEQAEGLDRIVQECTDSIAEQVEELRRIANEFSAYARLPVVERVPASLNGPIEDALNLFLPALPDGVSLERELDPDLPEVPLDPEQVRRVVINLIRNALDAMGERGVLTVRSGRAPDAVWLQVADTGEGIAPEVQERLFEPYFSTKTDGTGLGLAITRAVVDAHGGSLQVESRPGEGTTMTARFPLH